MENSTMEKQVYVTEQDMVRLEAILDSALWRTDVERENIGRLSEDLNRAILIEAMSVPSDLVTMNSKVCITDMDSGEEMTFTLVYPEAADFSQGRVSVLAPIGSAVLGYRTGDVVEWQVPAGRRRLKIRSVLGRPETLEDQESA